jgi:ABC-2 type transport system permease protein
MSQRAILWGVIRYEFKMQARRRSLWIVFAGITLIMLVAMPGDLLRSGQVFHGMSLLQQLAAVTFDVSWLPVIGMGVFLADRFPRDRSHRVDELFESTVGTLNTRLAGKYLGCLLGTLLPAFLSYCFAMSVLAFYRHTLLVFPLSLVTYTAIVLPGVCFITAFTLACTSVIWVPLYQFLFIGYWFWGNMLISRTGLPTLATTILTPRGSFIAAGLFNIPPVTAGMPTASLLTGIASMLLLLLIPLLVMLLFYRGLKWEQSHR